MSHDDDRPVGADRREALPWIIVLLIIAAVSYNGVLAYLNARGISIERSYVVITEIAILSTAGLAILASGPRRGDAAPALFLAFFVLDALVVSMLNNALFVEMARNAAIVGVFMMLGARIDSASLNRCFMFAALVVTAILLLEMASAETYAAWFAPADYFANTRGIAKAEFDELGLFVNSLGFDSRFAIARIMDHRAGSIFLEQVSLANFAIVLGILLACNWRELGPVQRTFFAALTVLILLTTNSRLALALTLITPLACLVAARLKPFLTLLIMPATLLIAALVSMNAPAQSSDDLPGRLTKTIRALWNLDGEAMAGLNAIDASGYADSGYLYVIYASSILGMIGLWLFVSLVASENSQKLLRCTVLLNIYVFCSLTVSGNSMFSIKTAALLWLMVGCFRGEFASRSNRPYDRAAIVRERTGKLIAQPGSA